MNLKRLRDTENKKMVRAKNSEKPYKALQVRTNDDGSKLYVYDHAQWIELQNPQSADVETYGPVWKELEDETVGYYLTNEPTDLYSWDSGDEVAYRFMNGTTVLQSGKIDEGETPSYTGDTPTKPATAQYTYTFDDWDPEVGPIYKKTTYKATFTSTVNEYTITFVNDDGTTELDEQTLEYGATPVYAGETPTKEPTAQYTYTFSGWTPTIATVTADATYTATYSSEVNEYDLTIAVNDDTMGSVDVSEVTADYGTAISAEGNVLTIGSTTITATPETGYVFSSWGTLPASVSEDTTITATFEAAPTLLTYSELVALGTHEAILAELNTNDEAYYASLTTEGHIYEASPELGTTVAAIAQVVGETEETTTPLVVDGGVFMYMVDGTPGEGRELHTWYWNNF